jgi:hypothetical protein
LPDWGVRENAIPVRRSRNPDNLAQAKRNLAWVPQRLFHTLSHATKATILIQAGVTASPKRFHNLRASRQTELADQFPAHVVSSWLGNTEGVARQHYLMTLDSHFERAVAEPCCALLPALQSAAVPGILEPSAETQECKNPLFLQGVTAEDRSGHVSHWAVQDSNL